MQKFLRKFVVWLVVSVAAVSTTTACVPRKVPAPNDNMNALEYYQSDDRAAWLDKELASASLAIRDGKLGRDSDASPGKLVTPMVTMEVKLKKDGQPNFRRPTHMEVKPSGKPSISFEIRDNGFWDVCLGSGCSYSLANDGMGTDGLIKHDEKAIEILDEVLDTLPRHG